MSIQSVLACSIFLIVAGFGQCRKGGALSEVTGFCAILVGVLGTGACLIVSGAAR